MTRGNKTSCSKADMSLLFAVIVAICVGLDQWTKHLALQHLPLETARPFLPGLVELIRIENHGAAFGMLQGQLVFFLIATAAVCLVVLYVIYRLPAQKRYIPLVINLAFIIGGALGNLCDRVGRGSVVDFFSLIPISFPVFNVADIFVTCSAIAFILLFCFYYKEEEFSFLKK